MSPPSPSRPGADGSSRAAGRLVRNGVLRGAEQLPREPVADDRQVLRRVLLEGLPGLDRDPGSALRDLLLGDGLAGAAGRALHDEFRLGLGPFADPRGPGLARPGRAGSGSPVPHPRRPAAISRRGLAPVGAAQFAGRAFVFRGPADRGRVRSGRRRVFLGDEGGGVFPELFRVLRGLRRGDAHGAGGADRATVRALPFRQPGEEGLAEIAPDRLGVRAHLRRLLGPTLGFLARQ